MSENVKCVESLIKKAANAADSNEAMRFAQAALNAVNAAAQLQHLAKN